MSFMLFKARKAQDKKKDIECLMVNLEYLHVIINIINLQLTEE